MFCESALIPSQLHRSDINAFLRKTLLSPICQGFIFQTSALYFLRHFNITNVGKQAYNNFHQITSRLVNLNHVARVTSNKDVRAGFLRSEMTCVRRTGKSAL